MEIKAMMPELDKIYDRTFFQEWGCHHAKYIQGAHIIAQLIEKHFQPKSLVDLGCGCGVYSDFFIKKGLTVLAIDGVLPPSEESFSVPIEVRDLTAPIENIWEKFDLTICLEVAEHIPEEFLSPFLENITQFSDTLVLSAAPPFQRGHHHVNEQPKKYWKAKLQQVNFAYNRKWTGQFIEEFKKVKAPYMWMGENISVYERVS